MDETGVVVFVDTELPVMLLDDSSDLDDGRTDGDPSSAEENVV